MPSKAVNIIENFNLGLINFSVTNILKKKERQFEHNNTTILKNNLKIKKNSVY